MNQNHLKCLLSKSSCNLSAMAIPVPDLNPLENEWAAQLKRRSANMDLGI